MNIFGINKGDIVSITGAGGKTSLMFYLAQNLYGRKIITTTTKIYKPANHKIIINKPFDFVRDNQIIITSKNEVNDKLVDINKHCFNSNYDYIFIESDGAKMLPLKGYNDFEPVIHSNSNITIGVVDISTIGLLANSNNIFRLEEFNKITKLGDIINLQNLYDYVTNSNGIFKNSINKKILFINKCETLNNIENANILSSMLSNNVDKIVIGSVKTNIFIEENIYETISNRKGCR